jgi:orotidine-5'-phosphate decarboxylase
MTWNDDPKSRLIVALDVPDRLSALALVGRLSGHVGCFKLGLEIFVQEGPRLVSEVLERGERVFLDLKLHDIPNTVAGAVRSACRLGVHMLTLHSSGGARMLAAAREAADASPVPPKLLAVTALTSLSDDDMHQVGVGLRVRQWVDRLAELALQAGVDGLVASPLETSSLRNRFGKVPCLVVPGIRPAGMNAGDQARTAQPADAVRAGADFLVVGRPILQADDPVRVADSIVATIADGLRV